jgi:hypothetical protein
VKCNLLLDCFVIPEFSVSRFFFKKVITITCIILCLLGFAFISECCKDLGFCFQFIIIIIFFGLAVYFLVACVIFQEIS